MPGEVLPRIHPDPGRSAGEDARACREIVARHARTFLIASRLLPERKRRGAFAVYATCRVADDIVDTGDLRPRDSLRALRRFRAQAIAAMERRADQPILRELARAWHEFQLPDDTLRELFDALERDVHDVEFETWQHLEAYCEGVAGSVGEMCCSIFGTAAHAGTTAVLRARTLGVAMQLTNILRDIGEDARRGRCYLPRAELARYGLSREQVISGAVRDRWGAWRAFMGFEVGRARELYGQALSGIPLLQLDAQRCALACADGYAKILDAIEEADFDTLSQRVAASRLTLLGVAWRSWSRRLPGIALEPPALTSPSRRAPR
jgi:phytoene synthase